MPDVAILAYVSCGNVLVLGTDQPVNWSAFFEIRVRLSAELAIVPRSRFLVRSKMKAFHKCAPVGGHLPYTSGSSLGKREESTASKDYSIYPIEEGIGMCKRGCIKACMLRRLEDRIRNLCAKAVASEDTPEFQEVLEQLRAALHEHNMRLRKLPTEPQLQQRRRTG